MTFDDRSIRVRPSPRQAALQQLEFYAFIHFGVNTFTDREWGDGTESPSIFDPQNLDAEQWVRAVKSAGMGGLILTCKHHDGFCLWPSRYTNHSVASSPYKNGKGDVVREVSQACGRHGLKFGIYLSPWDRNCPLYGQGRTYDDFFIGQLTELLTGYGDIFSVSMARRGTTLHSEGRVSPASLPHQRISGPQTWMQAPGCRRRTVS